MRRAFALLTLLAPTLVQAAVPSQFTVQGVLRDSTGALQSMMVNVTVKLFDDRSAGMQIGPAFGPTPVMADNGLFTITITAPSLATDIASVQPWLEVTVGNDTYPRQLVTPVVYAVLAGRAEVATQADALSTACSGCVTDDKIGGVSGTKIAAGTVPFAALAQRAGYKKVSQAGHVDMPAGSVTILSLSMTPPGPGIVFLSATGGPTFWYHTNSANADPDRMRCCVSAGGEQACHDYDVPSTGKTWGPGERGNSSLLNVTHPFPYSGTGPFNAQLVCTVIYAPPINGSSYGYVDSPTMTAVYMPADAL